MAAKTELNLWKQKQNSPLPENRLTLAGKGVRVLPGTREMDTVALTAVGASGLNEIEVKTTLSCCSRCQNAKSASHSKRSTAQAADICAFRDCSDL